MKHYFRQNLIFFSAVILSFFNSCNNLTQNAKPKSNEGTKEYAYVTIGLNTSSARNIYPDLSLNNLTYTLKGKWEDETTDQTITSGTWSQISTEQLELQTGEWQFTLTAVHTTTNKTFTATLNTTVTTSTTSLNFTLHADEDYGDFSISVNITKPANFSTTTNILVSFTLKQGNTIKFNPDTQVYSNTAIIFAPDSSYTFAPGDYDMEINLIASDLYDSGSNKIVLNTYKDKLHVVAGFNTTKELSLNVNPVYDISYEYHDGTITIGQEGPAKFSRKSVTAPLPTLEKDYYTFLGWFSDDTDGTQYDEVSVTSRTYYARFTPTPYTITYVYPDGVDEDDIEVENDETLPATVTIEDSAIDLPSISYDGLYFGGWFESATYSGTATTSIPAGTHDSVTLNACLIDTLYVNSSGASTHTGFNSLADYALDSIDSAMAKIVEYDSDDVDWKVELYGDLTGCQTIDMQSYYANSITIKGSGQQRTINGNVSEDGGGSTLVVIATDDIPIILEDLIITGGKGSVANMSQWVGGGIYLQQGTLKLGNGVKVTGNTVGTLTSSNESYGGGVYVNPDATLYIYGTACVGDPDISTAPTEAASGAELPSSTYANFAQCGAGIYSYGNVYLGYSSYTDATHNTPATLTNGIIGNYGTFGGGIYIYAQDASSMGTVVMKSGKISYNFGCGVRTGKLSSAPSTFTMNGGEISYNKTKSDSGGAGVENSSSFVMNGGAISHNTAGKNCGGGVYNSGTFVMNDGEISYNTIDSTITGTFAQCNGGGVYNYTGVFTMEGGTISHNSAPNGRGGGVCTYGYNSGGTNVFWMKGGVISENTAQYGGGGIFNVGVLKLSGSPYIPAGDGDANDLALVKYKDNQNGGAVIIAGTLTPPDEANGLVAKITPMDQVDGQSKDWFTNGLIMFRGSGYEFYESNPENGIPSSWYMSDVPEALCHFEMSSNVPEKYQNCVVSRNGFLKKGYNITSSNYSNILSNLEDGTYYLNYQGTLDSDILTSLRIAIGDLDTAKTIELDLFEAALTGLDPFTGMTDTQNLITIVLPQSITSIGESAFFDCNELSRVVIKSNITEIGFGAFSACNALTYINIPDSVDNIGAGAFSDCSSLWLSKLPDGITELKQGVFQSSGMESMPWQENPAITKICENAFQGCQNFDGIGIGGVITTIEQDAFKNAKAGWITIGPNVTTIEPGAFALDDDYSDAYKVVFYTDSSNWTLTKEGAETIYLTLTYEDPDADPTVAPVVDTETTCWLVPDDPDNPDNSMFYDQFNYLINKYKDYTWTKTGS